MTEKKPVILISECIEHKSCRYDGNIIADKFVKRLKDYVTFIPVCPEVSIGLGIPREAIRIVYREGDLRLVYSKSGQDVTDKMTSFTRLFMSSGTRNYHGAILKNRSPSCGIKDVKVYKDIGKSPALSLKTGGFFGGVVKEEFGSLPVEDEKRLSNQMIKEHFLTRVFTLFRFDDVKEAKSLKALVAFQSHNKYLLMAYHQQNQKKLGKIVANHDGLPIEDVLERYEILLRRSLLTPLRKGKNINMLMHLLGYFKEKLSKDEKAYLLDCLEQYNNQMIPISIPLAILKSWVIRFDEDYLKNQTIFEPFPLELMGDNE